MERGAPPTRTASEAFVSDSTCIMQVSYYIDFTRLSITTSFLYRLGPNPSEITCGHGRAVRQLRRHSPSIKLKS